MYQVAASIWNRIADSQPLATDWAKQMFPLPDDQLDEALTLEEARITRETNEPIVAAAYLRVMPLLWEAEAISQFLTRNPNLSPSLLPIATADEAVLIASRDFPLSESQQQKLQQLLQTVPT